MKEDDKLQNFLMIAELLLRVSALENLLINNKIIKQEDLLNSIKETSLQAAKNMLKTAQVTGDLDQIIKEIQNKKLENN